MLRPLVRPYVRSFVRPFVRGVLTSKPLDRFQPNFAHQPYPPRGWF